MAVDFLRHIVNPIVNSYVERGLSPKVANELKKAVATMETKYKFDVFSGNISNLAVFLRSTDFEDLVNTFRIFDAEEVLVEILEKAGQAYQHVQEIAEAINVALSKLRRIEKKAENIRMEDIATVLKKNTSCELRVLTESTMSVKLDEQVEVKVRLLKNGLKLEFKVSTLAKPELVQALKKVARFVEQIGSI